MLKYTFAGLHPARGVTLQIISCYHGSVIFFSLLAFSCIIQLIMSETKEFFKPVETARGIDDLTREQKQNYLSAWVLAVMANIYIDQRNWHAQNVAETYDKETYYAISGVRGFKTTESRAEESIEMASTLMPVRAAFELPKLSFEQTVETLHQDLFERYKEYSAKPEDFNLVEVPQEDGSTEQVLMYTALKGIDLGDPSQTHDKKRSYNSLMDSSKTNQTAHTIESDGQTYDDRGLTREIYKALINKARAEGVDPLPDSPDLELWTLSLLPGEETGRGVARCADVGGDGSVCVGWFYRDDGGRDVRFRPAVTVE